MQVMDYGSMKWAEQHATEVPGYIQIAPLQSEDWSVAVRGVQRYEECVQHYFGEEINRGLWLGDTYVMYGEDSPLEISAGYVGVRRRKRYPAGWVARVLGDRNKEISGGIDQAGCFDVAWKQVMWWCVIGHFLLSSDWRKQGRVSFFRGEVAPGCSVFNLDVQEDANEGSRWGFKKTKGEDAWRRRNGLPDRSASTSDFELGAGYIFTSDKQPGQWYRDNVDSLTDLTWALGVDVEDYIDRLFRAGLSE
ncbi:hypothetical protein [Corynebacterium lowii]|uniref:Uncharacterized protein n=1 Tax=Corynebacterium lowii TaxID=1544413 RepID=A0A0Q0UFA5_9CORY|nr:hypothetical protein [Corynebacterium lowii]KQB86693.1 hypothetical protein Clow_00901 [Corynebacterium lowii]MDP9851378.1 hypothetical protein [Corynebacterium lowii]